MSGSHSTTREVTLDPDDPLGSGAEALTPDRSLAIFEIGRRFLASRHPAELQERIQSALLEHLQPDHAAILRCRPSGELTPVWSHGLDLEGPSSAWPLSHTVLRRAVGEGLAVLAQDVRHDTDLRRAESIQRFRIRSVLCVPLGRPASGAIYLDNRSDRPFSPADLGFLTAVALYATLVLDRAREDEQTRAALERSRDQATALQEELLRHEIVGKSKPLLDAYDMLCRFARAEAGVLLVGETGTGKELFARAYAAAGPRAGSPYVPVTIPALASSLVESELFGHVKGAFTEARRDKPGRLEIADRGVLFLDEVGEIEAPLQVKLLRFLDSGELTRVGDTAPRRIDALVVAATNRKLDKAVADGHFRADLLARLGHVVELPPLRARPGDVALLAEHFLARFDRRGGRRFSPEALDLLARHSWPFNVRELKQVVERAVCLFDDDPLRPEHLPEYLRTEAASRPLQREATAPPGPLKDVVEDAERVHIQRALEYTQGNKRRAMELLGVSPDTFYRRLEHFGLHRRSRG